MGWGCVGIRGKSGKGGNLGKTGKSGNLGKSGKSGNLGKSAEYLQVDKNEVGRRRYDKGVTKVVRWALRKWYDGHYESGTKIECILLRTGMGIVRFVMGVFSIKVRVCGQR